MFSRIDVFPIKDHLKDVLKLHGLKTDQDILAYSIEELIKTTRLETNEIEQILIILNGNLSDTHSQNAVDCLSQGSSKHVIPTFSTSIDQVLDGGFQTGCMYQFYGERGSGKTQLCLQLASIIQLPKSIGLYESSVIYIDTENSFRPERFAEICLATKDRIEKLPNNNQLNLDIHQMLSNLFLFKCTEPYQLISLILHQLESVIADKKPKLIILDSIAYQFRYGYDELINFKRKLLLLISQKLKSLAFKYDICIICINQISCDLDKQKLIPCLGIWNHTPFAHLKFSREHANIRRVKGEKSCFKVKSAFFKIEKHGIRDLDDTTDSNQIANQNEKDFQMEIA